MKNYEQVRKALFDYQNSWKMLNSIGVVKNKKDFTSQVGEWFVCQLYSGIPATNANQEDWDLMVDDQFVQVKAHSKAVTNNVRRTTIKYLNDVKIDLLVLIIFTEDYKLKELYKIPWKQAIGLLRGSYPTRKLYWDDLNQFKENEEELTNQELLKLFR